MDRKRMMELLSMMESSGGKNREHPVVTQGVQKGHKSVSSYGLMPNTVFELAKRDKNFAKSPIGQQVLGTKGDPDAINQITLNTGNDDMIQSTLMDDEERRITPYVNNPDDLEPAMVYAHRRGVSGAIKALDTGDEYKNDPYVQDYLQKKAVNPRIDGEDPKKQAMLGALNSLANK